LKIQYALSAFLAVAVASPPSTSAQSPARTAGTPAVVDRLERADPAQAPRIPFAVHRLDSGAAEVVTVLDVDGNGLLDLVAADSWYEAPTWTKHRFREVPTVRGYVDVFSDFPVDVDRDGATDLVTFHYFGQSVSWYRNPGAAGGEWARTEIDAGFSTEFARLVDIDNDGMASELLPQTTSRTSPLSWYELVAGKWIKHPIDPASHPHGIGTGDVNGDGRTDVLTPDGWFEAPTDPRLGSWTLHPGWAKLGLPQLGFLHVLDVNRDGRADVLTSSAHDYGVLWLEQLADGEWRWHSIDDSWSEAHPSVLVDMDGNGTLDLVTAKRYMGHNASSPGATEPLGVYWYEFRPGSDGPAWTRHTVSYDQGVGGGLQMLAVDIDGDRDIDIVAPGKTGLHLIENRSR
jgi:hypothetical protein